MRRGDTREDIKIGKKIFLKMCSLCHTTDKAGCHKMGPKLYGVFGREVGTSPDFDYSNALKKSEVIWSKESLDKYLDDPAKHIPGNRMPFCCINNADERRAVIAYLESATKES